MRVSYSFFGILTSIFGGIIILVCSILYYLAEPFDFFSTWISDLGGVKTNSGKSPNGSNIIFSAGLILLTIFSIPFIFYLAKYLLSRNQKLKFLIYLSVISSIITYVGVIGVSIVDIKTSPFVHTYFATLFFFGGMTIMLFFSLSMFFNRDIPRRQALFSLFCSIIPMIFILTFMPYAIQGENVFLLVVSTDPKLGITRFLEWMYLFAFFSWFFETGIYTFHSSSKKKTRLLGMIKTTKKFDLIEASEELGMPVKEIKNAMLELAAKGKINGKFVDINTFQEEGVNIIT